MILSFFYTKTKSDILFFTEQPTSTVPTSLFNEYDKTYKSKIIREG